MQLNTAYKKIIVLSLVSLSYVSTVVYADAPLSQDERKHFHDVQFKLDKTSKAYKGDIDFRGCIDTSGGVLEGEFQPGIYVVDDWRGLKKPNSDVPHIIVIFKKDSDTIEPTEKTGKLVL